MADRADEGWAGWGDPARAVPLPEPMRAMLRALGARPGPPRVPLAEVTLPPPRLPAGAERALAAVVGAAYLHTDTASRARHSAGRSTPDLIRQRMGYAPYPPDAVIDPGSAEEVQAVLAACAEQRVGAPGLAWRGARAGPAPAGPAARRRPGRADRDPAGGGTRAGRRPAARRARVDAGPPAAVVRARDDRRVRGDPLGRAGLGGLRPLRRHGGRAGRGHPGRPADPGPRAGVGGRTRPAAAVPRLGGRARGDHLGHRTDPAGAGESALRGLAVRVVRGGHRRRAPAGPGRSAARGAAAVRRTGDDADRAWGRRLPAGRALRRRRTRRRYRAARSGRDAAGPGARGGVGGRPVRRALPARRRARRGRVRRDARHRRVLARAARAAPRHAARPARRAGAAAGAGTRPRLARLRDRRLALLHRALRARGRSTGPVDEGQDPGQRRYPRSRRHDQPPPRRGYRPPRLVPPGGRAAAAVTAGGARYRSSTTPSSASSSASV